MRNGTSAIAVAVAAFLALLGAALGQDALFRIQAWIVFTVLALGAVFLLRRVSFGPAGAVAMSGDASVYNDDVIRWGVIATLFWGTAGLLVGVIAATQLAFPAFNIPPFFNFGRLRPLHTSAVIFAFGGNALIATSFYVVQRTCRARLFGGWLPSFRVLGLSALHRAGGNRLSPGHHPGP